MAKINLKIFSKFDWTVFFLILLLLGLSLTLIYSYSLSQNNHLFFFKKQAFFAVSGLALLFLFSAIDYHILKTYSYWIYLFSLFLLMAVLLFGATINGTKGWFALGIFRFQPVELTKIALILVLARFFSYRAYEIKKFSTIVLSGILLAPAIFLVLLQPDLGSAIILFFIWLGMAILSGIKKKHLFFLGLAALAAFALAWFFWFKPYQKNRILTFLYPARDPLSAGYNVIQSTITVGSGRFLGKGISFGSQSQLKFLPEAHTDFIFATLAETLGFLGVTFTLAIYGLLFWRLSQKARLLRDDFAIFLLVGILIYLITQIFFNIAMNIKMAPVMGLPLPLLSYGGSSLLITLIMLGIALNILKTSD